MTEQVQGTRQTHEAARKKQTPAPAHQEAVVSAEQAAPCAASVQRAIADPRLADPTTILTLQRAAGNRAVTRLIQAKLMVGSSGNQYLQEASCVAGQGVSWQEILGTGQQAAANESVQRQDRPAEIGRVQRNRHLQEIVTFIRNDGRANTLKPPSPDWRMPLPLGTRMVDHRVHAAAQRQSARLVNVSKQDLGQSRTVQRAWTTDEVNQVLKTDEKGKAAVTDLNDQGYSVLHFDKYEFERQFYTDSTKNIKDGPPVTYTKNGWHTRAKKEIALSDQANNKGAASTLVHEIAHANQHKANEKATVAGTQQPFPDIQSKEVDAHIRQEEFNRAAGIPPKHESFRKVKGEELRKAVTAYVERVYAVGKGKRYYTDTEPKYNIMETIKPWPAIK